MNHRADIFEADLDVSDFKPQARTPGPPAEAVREVAERTAFKSREPEAGSEKQGRVARRIYRTGRNAQFSCKAEPDVVDRFYTLCNREGWVMGETLRRAVEALERELAKDA